MNRAEVLEAAKKCVCGQREQDYGNPEGNFQRIADLWNAYMGGKDFTPKDVAMMMALLKAARIRTGTGTDDCYVDLAGYAACAGEIATRTKDGETMLVRNIRGEEFEVKVRDLVEHMEDDRK